MINEYSRMFLIDAVCRYRKTEKEMLDLYCSRTHHAHDDAADYLCAAVEAFLENDDEDFRDILNRASWNGEETPSAESLVEQMKERAIQIDKEHKLSMWYSIRAELERDEQFQYELENQVSAGKKVYKNCFKTGVTLLIISIISSSFASNLGCRSG